MLPKEVKRNQGLLALVVNLVDWFSHEVVPETKAETFLRSFLLCARLF